MTLPVLLGSPTAQGIVETTASGGGISQVNLTEIGGVGVTTPLAVSGTVTANPNASAVGGYAPGSVICANSNNATVVKSAGGTLGFVQAFNLAAAPRYLKFYNKASAAPIPGTDVPVLRILIPANTTPANGAGITVPLPPQGANFPIGIGFVIVTGEADSDNTSPAASDVIVNYAYL